MPTFDLDLTPTIQGLQQTAGAAQQLQQQLAAAAEVSRGSFQAQAQAAIEAKNRIQEQTEAVRQAAAVQRELSTVLRTLREQEKQLQSQQGSNQGSQEQQKIAGLLRENAQVQAKVRAEINLNRAALEQERAAAAAVRGEIQQQANAQKLATAAAKDAAAAEKQVAQAAKEAGQASQESTQSNGGFLGGLLSKLGPIAAGLLSVQKLFGAIKEGVSDYAELSGIEATFAAVTGSAGEGAQELAFVREQANRVGIDLVPAARAYTSLLAAAKEANIPLAVSRDLFEGLTDAGRVLGRSNAEVESSLRAVEQMISKGTVSSQELKLQLGNALPGAFGIAAKAAGLTTAELTKQVAEGKVLAADFLPKLARQLKLTYGDATADAATQVAANLGRINSFFAAQSAKFGSLFTPLIGYVAQLVSPSRTLTQVAQDASAAYYRQAEAAEDLSSRLPKLLAQYADLSQTTGTNKERQQQLRAVIDELTQAVPGAVTAFDQYGNALGVNGKAVTAFINQNNELAKNLRGAALREAYAALKDLKNQQADLQVILNKTITVGGVKRLTQTVYPDASGGEQYDIALPQGASDQRFLALGAKAAELQNKIREVRLSIKGLNGDTIRPTVDADAVKASTGLLEQLQLKLKTLKEAREKAVDETAILKKGGLNDQIEDTQRQIDRLLEKAQKGAKTQQNALLAALKSLETERRKLLADYNKAELASVRDQGQALAAEQYRQARAQIATLEQSLKDKEAAVRKAGGKGANADGVIDSVQREQLNRLEVDALDRYYAALFELEQKHQDQLFALRADSFQKEEAALERTYAREVRAAQGQADLLLALEEKKQRDLLNLRQRQRQQQIDETQQAQTQQAQLVGETYGVGTGVSSIEAKRAEKKALLEVEKQAAEDSLNNTLLLNDKEGTARRAALQVQLQQIKNGLQEVEQEKSRHQTEDFLYKLVLGENDSEENRALVDQAVSQVAQALDQIVAAQLNAAQAAVQARERNLNDLQTTLLAEIALRKEGAASNVQTTLDQIKAERLARNEALREQRKAQKEQAIISGLSQISNIASASAKIIDGWATVPFVGSLLGIAAVGAMIAAFVVAQNNAKKAVAATTGSFFKGGQAPLHSPRSGYTGAGNPQEESRSLGNKDYTYHKREFVFNHETTEKHVNFFQALHKNELHTLSWQDPTLRAIQLAVPVPEIPEQITQNRQQTQHLLVQHQYAPMQLQLQAQQVELVAIRQQMELVPKELAIPLLPGGITHVQNAAGTQRTSHRLG